MIEILLNTINNKLESIDISNLSQEEKEKVIKLVNDNENRLFSQFVIACF